MKRRTYDATGRRRRAADAQERALDAARRLFAERGYSETPMEAIAREAGLAVPTLYAAFGSKKGILARLLSRPGESKTGPARAPAFDDHPATALSTFVAQVLENLERSAPLYEALKSAARAEPGLEELVRRTQQQRFNLHHTLAAHLQRQRALRPTVTVDDAAYTTWALLSPEIRQVLLDQAGWAPQRYRGWVLSTLSAALLPDGPTL